MLGLLLYLFLAGGLGAWVPSIKFGEVRSFGATLLSGYALLLLALFLFFVVLDTSMPVSLWLIVAIAAAGWIRLRPWLRDWCRQPSPGMIFPVFAVLAIVVNGEIGYLPYTVDEFTNWIGVSREIYLNDGYTATAETIYLPGYLPGWRLLLIVPWLAGQELDLGQSAAAPLVLHIGLVTLIFEIVRNEARRHRSFSELSTLLMAWGVVLLYLAAEGTGRLWTYNLLIEQPQIYAITACLLYFYLLSEGDIPTDRLFLHVGLTVVSGYLLKSAMLTFMPGLLLVLAFVVSQPHEIPWSRRFARMLRKGAILMLPTVIVIAMWKGVAVETAKNCLSSPLMTLTPDSIAKIAGLDWQGLLVRYSAAIGAYVASYKTLVLLAATAGAAAALMRGKWIWLIVYGAFAIVYVAALYWYHLACFGPYYFETLNSIPRFMRVVIQPFHAVGLVAIAVGSLPFIAKGPVAKFVDRRIFWVAAGLTCTMLFSWQAVQLYRSVEDVTARRYQAVDTRIAEVRAARDFIRNSFSDTPKPMLVQFISQGTDRDILGYAKMYALDGVRGAPQQLFRYAPQVSWAANAAQNIWQQVASKEHLVDTFREANIIWPIVIDPYITDVLQELAPSVDCANNLLDRVLVKTSQGTFICRRKPR